MSDRLSLSVEETCTMGCDGLDFCTNFNNRPTELFRSCNKMADEGARKEVAMWTETGEITLPEFQTFKIPIKGKEQSDNEKKWKQELDSFLNAQCNFQREVCLSWVKVFVYKSSYILSLLCVLYLCSIFSLFILNSISYSVSFFCIL